MTNKKNTKGALLSSALAMLLCMAMLIGTTFAWFTDTASTGVNKIVSGNLKVGLEYATEWNADGSVKTWTDAEGKKLDFIKAAENEAILWEPGCTYKLPELRVVNKGNLALKYSIQITGINGDAKLNEAIVWNFTGMGDGKLIAGASQEFTISGHMKEEAGNEYQDLSIEGIAITVFATQDTVESDSNDNQYDANAPFTSYWDGKTVTAPGDPNTWVDGVYHITNAAQFVGVMEVTSKGLTNSWAHGKTIVLDCNIDFGGRTISGIGSVEDNIVFTFDGKNHTISNFKINNSQELYSGLFNQFNGTLKNLTVENATVIGNGMVGVIASNVDNGGKIEKCKVYDSTIIGAEKVGSVAGYIAGAGCTITGCYAENVNVYCADAATSESGEIVGYINNAGGDATVTGNTYDNVNVYRGSVSTVENTVDLKNTLTGTGKAVFLTSGTTYDLPNNMGKDVVIIGNGAEMTAPVIENYNRIYSEGATFNNVVFKGNGKLWIKDTATFVDCEFNCEINNAEPVDGTVTFEGCTFNKPVHFAPASEGASTANKFFEAKNCIFNDILTVQGFEHVTLTNCTVKGSTWAETNMISYCPVTFNHCTLANGVRLASGVSANDVTCVSCNITVKLH